MATSEAPANGEIDVPSFVSRLRSSKQLSEDFARRFASDLDRAFGCVPNTYMRHGDGFRDSDCTNPPMLRTRADRELFPGSALRKQSWQTVISVLRSEHGLFQHSLRAAQAARPMQEVAALRVVFEKAEPEHKGTADHLVSQSYGRILQVAALSCHAQP
jgi:type I site-specific restriction endonuclease